MKKLVSLLLVIVLSLALVACAGGGEKPAESKAPAESTAPAESKAPAESTAPSESNAPAATGHDVSAASGFGFFDADYDYSQEETHKIGLISYSWDNMLQIIADTYATWAKSMNVEFQSCDSNSDAETLISNIELYASQGYEGLIINAFSTYMDTVIDLCKELDVEWWSLSEPAVSPSTGLLTQPYMMSNDYQWGYDVMKAEIEWMQKNVPDFDPKQTMVLGISLTTLTVFVNRHTGFQDACKDMIPEAKFEVCDALSEGGINAETGYSIASTRATANPDIKFWIYADVMGYFSPGCLNYVEENNLTDNSIISSCGIENIIPFIEKGTNGAWRFALGGDYSIGFAAPFMCLYAVVADWCTYEDIWADVKPEGETYSHIDSAYVKISADNYKDYLAFTDEFCKLDKYPYEWSGKEYSVVYGDGKATE